MNSTILPLRTSLPKHLISPHVYRPCHLETKTKNSKTGGGDGEFDTAGTKHLNTKNAGNENASPDARDCINGVDVGDTVESNARHNYIYNGDGGDIELGDENNGGAHAARNIDDGECTNKQSYNRHVYLHADLPRHVVQKNLGAAARNGLPPKLAPS